MAQTDLSAIAYFAPIAAFLVVFVISYAIFAKSKLLGENKWLNIFISFLISSLFISAGGAITYVRTITPWFAVLLISMVFILMLTGILGKPLEKVNKGIGIAFVVLAGVIFIVAAFVLFSHLLTSYLPGPNFGAGLDEGTFTFLDWLYSPRVGGALILVIISAVVSWVLVKAK